MTTESKGATTGGFASATLPWMIGAVGLAIYCFTLNRWISLSSLGTVAWVSGWSWQPELKQPLTFFLLFPFRWLPEQAIPPALNIFSALCAAVVLAFLARSVALVPHDLTPDDPMRRDRPVSILSTPTAWLPPVLATIVCGLQLSFWEHATSASGEMIDLLVFAYVVRCILEFGVSRKPAWLSRWALVYGAGMANNWAMAACLPLFLVAIVRTNSLERSLNRRFWLRLALWGSAGLSLFLFLPMAQSLSSHDHFGFWPVLRVYVKLQKDALVALQTPAYRLVVMASLLPLFILSIRWKSHTVQLGDDTRLGVFIIRTTGHLVHGLFLIVALWIALDPTFSPRHSGLNTSLLPCYYISALAVGYCAGYFLLTGDFSKLPQRFRRLPAYALGILTGVMALALLGRNLPPIRLTNGPVVREFAQHLYEDLPEGKCVALSEDLKLLLLLQPELGARHRGEDCILLDTALLPLAPYQRHLAGQFKMRWPVTPPINGPEVVGPFKIRDLVSRFAAKEQVVYLHPSSGLLCEPFVDQPQGLVHCLLPRPEGDPFDSRLTKETVITNEQIWQRRWTNGLEILAGHITGTPEPLSPWIRAMQETLRLRREPNGTAAYLGAVYSKALNCWGVEMQRQDQWTEAGVWFRRALALNSNNLAARINVTYNERVLRGNKHRLDAATVEVQFRELFARRGNWADVLNEDGQLDEPTFLLRTARVWLPGGNTRQALRGFARCVELAPDWPLPKLYLATSYLRLGKFARALELTDQIEIPDSGAGAAALSDFLYCRGAALHGLDQTNEADIFIQNFVDRFRDRDEVVSTAAELYTELGEPERALALLDELLKRNPNRTELLAKKGWFQLQLSQYDAAIATLTQALLSAPGDEETRLRRAAAYLGADQLDAARSDYQELLRTTTYSQAALFGLGGIAWRQHDTAAAIQFYASFLSNGVPDSPQYALASKRFKQMTASKSP
jgi:tetratricopeptide (TPR) repeat protein